MQVLTGAQALVRCLRAEQIKFVFGIVGGKLGPLLHAISQQPELQFVGVRHEAAGPMMAAAVHAGSGVGVTFNNNLPLLAITTNQHRAAAYPHSGMFMDLDTLAVTRPITKWNAVVHDGRRLPDLVRRAFREACTGRPGPVHLDVPQDVLAATVEFVDDEFELPAAQYRAMLPSRPSSAAVDAALTLLIQAKRPLVVAGGGVVASGATLELRRLADRLNAPIVPTQMALGVVSSDNDLFVGHGGLIAGEGVKAAFAAADVILSVGCRWSSWMWDERGAFARRQHQVISINTDPAALGHPVPHAVAMLADAKTALQDLLAAWPDALPHNVQTDWPSQAIAARQRHAEQLQAMAAERGAVMHPAALAKAIADALPHHALAVFDGGHTTFWSNDLTPAHTPRTRFHEPGMSHLGFGLPYALSLQLQHPSTPVVLITGDGSFGFTLQELDTARRLGLAVVVLIHNNASWGIIRSGQRKGLNFELGTGLDGTDYAAIAKGFGCYGETVTTPDEVAPAMARAWASGLPAVLDCRTHFVPHPAAPMFGAMNKYGFEALSRSAE
jgi:thiamine pyrophosphate-dependent acetolactate synthase large subunit-like protein